MLFVTVYLRLAVISNLKAEPLAVIADADHMMARAWIPVSDLDKYSGLKAQAVKVGDQKFTAVSQQLQLEPNEKGQYALDVIIATGDKTLHAGQAASIIFP